MGHEMFKGEEVLETTVQKSRPRDSEIRKSESQGLGYHARGKGSGNPCEEPGIKDEGHQDHWPGLGVWGWGRQQGESGREAHV